MRLIIKAKDPKHERRLKRWEPFIHDAFKHLRTIIRHHAKKLSDEIMLKTLKGRRMSGTDFSVCIYWGMMGHEAEGEWWLAMSMDADTYKFRNTLLHEIAHFGAVAINNNWKDNAEWAALFKKLKKEMR